MINLRNVSIGGLIIAVISIVYLLFRDSLFAVEPVGITIQVLAALLMVWARWTFGRRSFHAGANPTEGGLVTTGPYRFLRHPIYAALLYFTWTGVLSHASLPNVLLGLCMTAGLSIRMVAEERLVAERYPEYAAYAAKTRRVIPYVL